MNKSPLISVVIPTYNEEKSIKECIESLKKQSYKPLELILVDDGSTDKTIKIISNFAFRISNFMLLRQQHKGPGPARNLGASKAKGSILVFADADMTFDKDFIHDLTIPIREGKTIGTFSKNEMVKNKDDVWSICWNINRNVPPQRMLPENYPDHAQVFRAILKSQFIKVGGFDATGEYTDDWSLSRKLNRQSSAVKGAVYYHSNPASIKEIWGQARWIGKNEFIAGTILRKIRSFILYSLPISFIVGIYKSVVSGQPSFVLFKLIYDLAVWISVVKSFFGEAKSK